VRDCHLLPPALCGSVLLAPDPCRHRKIQLTGSAGVRDTRSPRHGPGRRNPDMLSAGECGARQPRVTAIGPMVSITRREVLTRDNSPSRVLSLSFVGCPLTCLLESIFSPRWSFPWSDVKEADRTSGSAATAGIGVLTPEAPNWWTFARRPSSDSCPARSLRLRSDALPGIGLVVLGELGENVVHFS
jgi:hypothetical protein